MATFDEMPEEQIGGQPQMSEQEFMESLQNLMSQLSDGCRTEFETALSNQDMELLSPGCKAELSSAASQTNQFEKARQEGLSAAADDVLRAKGLTPNPYTKYYVFSTLLVFLMLTVAYIVWVNKKLAEAGLLDKKPKSLSKKKLEKQKAKMKEKGF